VFRPRSTWENAGNAVSRGLSPVADAQPGVFATRQPIFPLTFFFGAPWSAGVFAKPLGEVSMASQWREAKKWKELHDRVLSVLPYPVPITPGTCSEYRWSGCREGLLIGIGTSTSGHVFIAGRALNQLQTNGITDLFAVPVS
jgi:hypothetical protein